MFTKTLNTEMVVGYTTNQEVDMEQTKLLGLVLCADERKKKENGVTF